MLDLVRMVTHDPWWARFAFWTSFLGVLVVAVLFVPELIDWLGLTPHAHQRCGGFSKGMLQKVALAGALVHDPKLIILDEPLTGLDAGSARQVKQVLLDKVRQGVTVIMTTHILEVAERMAERIGVINHGRLIAEGTLAELRSRIGREDTLEEIFLDLVAQKEMDVDPTVDAAA